MEVSHTTLILATLYKVRFKDTTHRSDADVLIWI